MGRRISLVFLISRRRARSRTDTFSCGHPTGGQDPIYEYVVQHCERLFATIECLARRLELRVGESPIQ